MNLAVVLVSKQTIPNVVYLKNLLEYGEGFDRILLLTTAKMESSGTSDAILRAVGNYPYDKLVVDENMLFDVNEKLSEYFNNNKYDEVFANVTGGTKIMSLATFKFFEGKSFVDSIVYLPINSTSYKQIYPLGSDGKAADIPIGYKMGVEEYIKALGVDAEYGETLNETLSKNLLNKYFDNEGIFNQTTSILRPYRSGGKKVNSFIESEDYNIIGALLLSLGVDIGKYDMNKRRWIDYFSGGWFEEYVYSQIKDLVNSCVDDVKINIKIKSKREVKDEDVPNEFDVIFIKNNSLYIIECKSGDLQNSEMMGAIYKLARLNQEFGLSATSYFVTMDRNIFDKNDSIKAGIKNRSKLYRIIIAARDDIKNGLSNFFKGKLKCR